MPRQKAPRSVKHTTTKKPQLKPAPAKVRGRLKARLDPARKTDEELFREFRLAVSECKTCKGTRAVRPSGKRWVSARRESVGAQRCPDCKVEQDRVFNYWLDRIPPDGKRSWRTRIQSFVVKNHKGYQQVVGTTVSAEDIEQDVLLAVWMVWDKYYNPNYRSEKTGQPVKLCTYVWRAIQTAWAKVTERCFCVRNTVHMIRKEDAGSEEHQPIYDRGAMRDAITRVAKLDAPPAKVDEIAAKCRTSHDKRPFTLAMLSELVAEADQLEEGNMLTRLSTALPKVAKKKRNAVPAHMMMKSLDASAGSEEDASKNSELVSEIDHRIGQPDAAAASMAAQARAIVARQLAPIDQRILFDCIAGDESIRSVATQFHMTVAETKARLATVRQWLEDAKRNGTFAGLLE